jgi:hypothetical protein
VRDETLHDIGRQHVWNAEEFHAAYARVALHEITHYFDREESAPPVPGSDIMWVPTTDTQEDLIPTIKTVFSRWTRNRIDDILRTN